MRTDSVMEFVGSAAWGFRELALPAQLTVAEGKGMVYHELGIANADTDVPLDAPAEVLETVKKLYESHGIRLTCAATGNDFTGEDVKNQVHKVFRVIDMCKILGVRKLRIFTGFTPLAQMTEARWKALLDALDTVSAFAREQGVTLCVETHGAVEPVLDGVRHIRSTSTQLPELLRILERTDVQLVFDPANLFAVGEPDIAALFDTLKHRIGYVHLKDFRTGSIGQLYPCSLGGGGTDWKSIAEQLLALEVPLLFEYENPRDLGEGLDACIAAWKGAFSV